MKSTEIIEKGETYTIGRNILKSPIFFVSERDAIEKRIEFFKKNSFHSLTSSVNDSIFPPVENIVRCYTWINSFNLFEEEDNFIFESFNQYDLKVNRH